MNKLFVRLFFDDGYVTYCDNYLVKINLLYYLNVDKIIIVQRNGNKITSNIKGFEKVELNKYYYIGEYKIILKVGVKTHQKCIALVNKNLLAVFNEQCDISIDYDSKLVFVENVLFIDYRKVYQGKYSYKDGSVFCYNGVEFTIIQDTLYINEYFSNYFNLENVYKESLLSAKNNVDYHLEFDFVLADKFKEFNEVIWKYLVSPVITLLIMGSITFITKRQSMLIFMFASVFTTSVTSILTYIIQKRKVDYYNNFLQSYFEKKLESLLLDIKSNIESYYSFKEFKIHMQRPFVVGHTKIDFYKINIDVKEKKLKKVVEDKVSNIPLYFDDCSLASNFLQISIFGKYSYVYLHNFILQLVKTNSIDSICVIGNLELLASMELIIKVDYFNEYFEMCSTMFDSKTLFVVSKIDFNESENFNRNTIYFECNLSCSNVLKLDDKSLNILEKQAEIFVNKSIYTYIETNIFKFELLCMEFLREKSVQTSSNAKGLQISTNYFLDIDKYGPHGLIVGMTGSGKSILLQTMILAIAKMYSPAQAVISIIDFKGEALINRVKKLPHICATYSNLNNDYENIVRSIEAEIEYRQIVFNEAKISEYHELHGKYHIPRLFLFIDEFAELKYHSSEIVKRIVSIARLGRSLGIYLVLSLQKSGGIVDEQLNSNLGYKICLKVNSKQDSIDISGCEDAFYFTKPGQAIVSISNQNYHINVLNCMQPVKDDIVIDGINHATTTIFNSVANSLCKRFEKTNYVVWKNFPSNYKCGILINSPYTKEFIKKVCEFDNYIIVAQNVEERLALVNTIVSQVDCAILYLGKDVHFVSDLSFSNLVYLEVYVSYMNLLKKRVYFVIDGVDYYVNEKLGEIINNIIDGLYTNIRVIICARTVNTLLARVNKKVSEKFLFSHEDSGDVYNLFFKRSAVLLGERDVGLCVNNSDLITFKNYSCDLNRKRKYSILDFGDYIYLDNLERVNFSKCLIVFDKYIPVNFGNVIKNLDCKYNDVCLINYKHLSNCNVSTNKLLTLFKTVIVATPKYEVNFRKIPMYHNMMYDITNEMHIIITKHLDCY